MASGAERMRDVIVVGGGAAGLAAALALCRQIHSVAVFDSGEYRNAPAAEMHMVPTWDHRNPRDFLAASRAELAKRYPDLCTVVDGEATAVRRVSEKPTVFEAVDATGQRWRGRKVILATGVRDLLPSIDGFEDCWGTGILHCVLCHGHEKRGAASVGILALDAFAEPSTVLRIARACRQFAAHLRIYTNGNTRAAAQLRDVAAQVGHCDVESGPIDRVEMVEPREGGSGEKQVHIVLEGARDGVIAPNHVHAFAMYHAGTEQGSDLVSELGIELNEGGDIKVGPVQDTSVPGVFAAGDCASAHKFVTVASATGFTAGAGAAFHLQAEGPLGTVA